MMQEKEAVKASALLYFSHDCSMYHGWLALYLQNPFGKDAWQSCFLMAFETFLKAFPSMSHSSTQHDIDSLQLLSLDDKNHFVNIGLEKLITL